MLKYSVVTVFAVALSTTAFGQAKFSIEQGALGYSSTTSEAKPETGDAVKSTSTTMATMPSGMRLGASVDKLSFYVYPGSSSTVEVGYWAMDNLEAGVGISLRTTDSKVGDAKTNSANNGYGVWATYYMPMGDASVEGNFGFTMGSETGKDVDTAGAEVKTNKSSTTISLGANYVMPLAKNFSWLGGLNYTMVNGEDKEAKLKNTASTLGVNLTTLRLEW